MKGNNGKRKSITAQDTKVDVNCVAIVDRFEDSPPTVEQLRDSAVRFGGTVIHIQKWNTAEGLQNFFITFSTAAQAIHTVNAMNKRIRWVDKKDVWHWGAIRMMDESAIPHYRLPSLLKRVDLAGTPAKLTALPARRNKDPAPHGSQKSPTTSLSDSPLETSITASLASTEISQPPLKRRRQSSPAPAPVKIEPQPSPVVSSSVVIEAKDAGISEPPSSSSRLYGSPLSEPATLEDFRHILGSCEAQLVRAAAETKYWKEQAENWKEQHRLLESAAADQPRAAEPRPAVDDGYYSSAMAASAWRQRADEWEARYDAIRVDLEIESLAKQRAEDALEVARRFALEEARKATVERQGRETMEEIYLRRFGEPPPF